MNTFDHSLPVVFLLVDKNNDTADAPVPVAAPGSGSVGALFYCSRYPPGDYYLSWRVYLQPNISPTSLVAWSDSNERLKITC